MDGEEDERTSEESSSVKSNMLFSMLQQVGCTKDTLRECLDAKTVREIAIDLESSRGTDEAKMKNNTT